MGNIRWLDEQRVPLLSTTANSGLRIQGTSISDLRPVFPEEKRLLEVLLGFPRHHFRYSSVWETNSSRLIVDGRFLPLSKGEYLRRDPREIAKQIRTDEVDNDEIEFNRTILQTFAECNKSRLEYIEDQAWQIIKQARDTYSSAFPVVSFSGGKDSTVVSHLVRRAYGKESILHVFGDTTLEFPETYEYVSKMEGQGLTCLPAKSEHNFGELCKRLGPPSRVMRWCCTVFKTAPIAECFDSFKQHKYLTYYGIRRAESPRRQKYQAIEQSPKVSSQVVVAPILHWLNADIWLYLAAHGLEFNRAYRYGFSRVGCWCCPSNSKWSFFLSRVFHPELAEPWRRFLVNFAQDMGKPDPEVYVDSGNWKARQGGSGVPTAALSLIRSRPCGDDPNARYYELTQPITPTLYEYFKPFGKIDSGSGRTILNQVFVVDRRTGDVILDIQGAIGSKELRVAVINSSDPTLFLHRIDCQMRKYQSCIRCGGCTSACPRGAIVYEGDIYRIQDNCTGCLSCINHFDTGCLVSKVLQVKRGSEA